MVKWIAIGFAAIIAIAIVYVVAAYNYPAFRVATRDIAIIILACLSMWTYAIAIVPKMDRRQRIKRLRQNGQGDDTQHDQHGQPVQRFEAFGAIHRSERV